MPVVVVETKWIPGLLQDWLRTWSHSNTQDWIWSRGSGQESLNSGRSRNYRREIWSTHTLHGPHSHPAEAWPPPDRRSRSTLGRHPGWSGGGGGGCRPLALQVWLSTMEETHCSVTVMNECANPLIIAHSGAERGPLIKMSWDTAGLFHLWHTPSCLNNLGASPQTSASKEPGRCEDAVILLWQQTPLPGVVQSIVPSREQMEREESSLSYCQMELPLNVTVQRSVLCTYGIFAAFTWFRFTWLTEREQEGVREWKKKTVWGREQFALWCDKLKE